MADRVYMPLVDPETGMNRDGLFLVMIPNLLLLAAQTGGTKGETLQCNAAFYTTPDLAVRGLVWDVQSTIDFLLCMRSPRVATLLVLPLEATHQVVFLSAFETCCW